MGKVMTREECVAQFRPLLEKFEAGLKALPAAWLEYRREARGVARSILHVLATRGLVATAEQRALIEQCTDLPRMDRWLERAITARSIDEVLA